MSDLKDHVSEVAGRAVETADVVLEGLAIIAGEIDLVAIDHHVIVHRTEADGDGMLAIEAGRLVETLRTIAMSNFVAMGGHDR